MNPLKGVPLAAASLQPCDPKAGYLAHQGEIDRAIAAVLGRGQYVLGEEVTAFEREFAGFLSARCAVGVASGTDALQLALRACGVGPGDVVITVSLTAVATVAAIELVGATPLLVDIDPETFTMDPAGLRSAIESHLAGDKGRLKAVIPVHLYGQGADMPAVTAITRRHGLSVIEDCCQSHGASVAGRMTGTWGDAAAFSFYPTKNLGALGDGGAFVTNDARLASKARLLREYGWKTRQVSELPGMNSRLDELQAAILRVKLRYLAKENSRRVDLAGIYERALRGLPLELPSIRSGSNHVYHQYVIRSAQRDGLKDFLRETGVGTLVLYPVPVHLQPAYKGRVRIGPGGLGRTEQACGEVLCLPMHPYLTDAEAGSVAGLVSRWHAAEGGAP